MRLSIAFLFALLCSAQARTWTNSNGQQIEADYVSDDGKSVTIKRADGSVFAVPLIKLSAADQAFVSEQHKAPEPILPVDHFPSFDYGVAKMDDGKRDGFSVHRWAMLEVLTKDSVPRDVFEKAMKPVLGAHYLLEDLGFPKAAMPDKGKPQIFTLVSTPREVGKLAGDDKTYNSRHLVDGRVFGTLAFYGLLPGEVPGEASGLPYTPEQRRVRSAISAHRWVLMGLVPHWLAESTSDYAVMVPWAESWPQCKQAKTGLRKYLADIAAKKEFLITPSLIDALVAQPDVDISKGDATAAPRAAALVTLYYLRHLHGDGKGSDLKQLLAASLPQASQWRDYLYDFAAYNAVWEQIKADPTTQKLPDGRYQFSQSHAPPSSPQRPFDDATIESTRAAVQKRLLSLLGPKPGETVIAALRKAGLTDALADNSGSIASGAPAIGLNGNSLTPDYAKSAPARPHTPLDKRQWPVQIDVGLGSIDPTLVSSSAEEAVYHVGRFKLITGPKLTNALVKEIARTFIVVEELVERLPWDLPPTPPNGDRFIAKLYESREAYERIAPPSSGGFYSLDEKVFHVPYQSLGIEKKGGVWTKTKAFDSDTLVHELTHMMMDRVIRHLPIWATEGSAEYVENIPYKNGVMRLGDLPKALKDYVKQMVGYAPRVRSPYVFSASAKQMVNIMHMSAPRWNFFAGTGPPPEPKPSKSESGFNPIKIERPVAVPKSPLEISARQHDLYMHACLLFYYFLHLDNRQRGDPMLLLLDKANDLAPQWQLYQGAIENYRAAFTRYESAWKEFVKLPGVKERGDGRISYPTTLTPPKAPEAPKAPIDLSNLPDEDVGLANLETLTKGRSDEQLEKSIRAAFAGINITLE